MRSSTGRWVSGSDFFDRENELVVLERHVLEGNHVLLTGQRRMGKTSILRELGRRLEFKNWIFLFVDIEAVTTQKIPLPTLRRLCTPFGQLFHVSRRT